MPTKECFLVRFDWDERKNKLNRKKHGVWFEEAIQVFKDPYVRFFEDKGHSDQEERFIAIGQGSEKNLLIVIHSYRDSDNLVRIISARRATRKERLFMKKEYNFSKMKEISNSLKGKKISVGINLSPAVIDYFKRMSEQSGIPYQKLIDMYLLDCVQKKKKLKMDWAG